MAQDRDARLRTVLTRIPRLAHLLHEDIDALPQRWDDKRRMQQNITRLQDDIGEFLKILGVDLTDAREEEEDEPRGQQRDWLDEDEAFGPSQPQRQPERPRQREPEEKSQQEGWGSKIARILSSKPLDPKRKGKK